MARIQISCGSRDGKPWTEEVEGFYVPDTAHCFAVRLLADDAPGLLSEYASPEDEFVLTHVPTGCAILSSADRADLLWVAQQMYAAIGDRWQRVGFDPDKNALPAALRQWGQLLRRAKVAGVPLRLLKGYADFVRDGAQSE